MSNTLEHIVIVGGGLAGWIAASMLSTSVITKSAKITILLDDANKVSDSLAESLTPSSGAVHRQSGIKESELLLGCSATFNLGVSYEGWSAHASNYYHVPSPVGSSIDGIGFHHALTKKKLAGEPVNINDYSLASNAIKKSKFAHPKPQGSKKALFDSYAYSLNVETKKYLELLRRRCEQQGVSVVDCSLKTVNVNPNSGMIEDLTLTNDSNLAADFYFDATGNAALIESFDAGQAFKRWDDYLACDSCVSAVIAERFDSAVATIRPHQSGWQRIVPLRESQCIEIYYSSSSMSRQEAELLLIEQGAQSRAILHRHYRLGVRNNLWAGNCVAIGEAAGSIERFSVSSVHLTQAAVLRWMDLYPLKTCSSLLAREFNSISHEEYERILDFHCLHYHCSHAVESKFWAGARDMPLPPSLQHKLTSFKQSGRWPFYERETFSKGVWIAFLLGQGIWPKAYDEMLDFTDDSRTDAYLLQLVEVSNKISDLMPSNYRYTSDYLAASKPK